MTRSVLHEDYVTFLDEERQPPKTWIGKGTAAAAIGLGIVATCAFVASSNQTSSPVGQVMARSLASTDESHPAPPTIAGSSVKCHDDATPNAVYRYTGESLRLYRTAKIASWWDSNWSNAPTVDCDGITRDRDMYMSCIYELDVTGATAELKEGDVRVLGIAIPEEFANNEAVSSVTVDADSGLVVSPASLTFGPYAEAQELSVRVGNNVAADSKLSIRLTWNTELCGSRSHIITFTIRKVPGCRGHSKGDPHMRSLDGVNFDFKGMGYFKLVDTKGLRVDVMLKSCSFRGPTCTDKVAIRYGSSIVRFELRNSNVRVSKATNTLNDLSVYQAVGNRNSYRVFVSADPTTYIDVGKGKFLWFTYLDVTTVLSSFFKNEGNVKGLLGNGNGNGGDDVTSTNALSNSWKLPDNDNLVALTRGVEDFLEPPDKIDVLRLPMVSTLVQGYRVVSPANVNDYGNVLQSRELDGDDDVQHHTPQLDHTKVRAICTQAIGAIPYCKDTMGASDTKYYMEQLCVFDTVAAGDANHIDDVKLSFLDECRRALDEKEDQATESGRMEAANEIKILNLANPSKCSFDCGGRGQCYTNGCKCNSGFTGMKCEIEVSAEMLTVG